MRPSNVIKWTIRGLLVLAIVAGIFAESYMNSFTAFLAFVLTFLTESRLKNRSLLPPTLQTICILFIFTAMYLGEIRNFYDIFPWWDTMLHTFSGIILGILGVLLVYGLNEKRKITVHLSPFFIALFSFSFALCGGTVWEIFEFAGDTLLKMNMQRGSLTDTMVDLIVDALGAAAVSFLVYLVLIGQKWATRFVRWIKKISHWED